jgi:hypothetical protein
LAEDTFFGKGGGEDVLKLNKSTWITEVKYWFILHE